MNRNVLLLGILFVLGTALATAQNSDVSHGPLTISITAAQDRVSTGADVRIAVALTNNSEKTIILERTGIVPFRIEVRGSDMKPTPETERGRKLRELQEQKDNLISARVGLRVKPHATIQDALVVSDFYNMTRPDEYTIQLSETFQGVEARSNTLKITVTP